MPSGAQAVAAASLMVMLGACAVPAEYMGIATRMPIAPEDQARIDSARLRQGPIPQGCPWVDAVTGPTTIPCSALPASQLAGLAWSGNKHAALELGIRFEEGRGVPKDIEKARELYRAAAATTGGPMYVYSPPVGDSPGQVIPVSVPYDYGLPAATRRLLALPPPPPKPGRKKAN